MRPSTSTAGVILVTFPEMPDRVLPGPKSHSQVLRQLRFLVVVLIASNIGLGVFGVYVLREVDKKYSDLIGEAVPSLNDLQTLTALEMEAMRNTNPALFVEPPQGRAEMLKRAHLALDRDSDLRKHVLRRRPLPLHDNELADFYGGGRAFSSNAEEVLKRIESGDNAAANQLRDQSLRPAFDHYVAATTKIADVLQEESLQTSGELSARVGTFSQVLLGLASWPVMILGVFLVVAAVFVLVVLINVLFSRGEAV